MYEFSTAVLIFTCACFMVSIALLSTDLIYHQIVNVFVDGNNNGKNDVLEYWDSVMSDTSPENQQQRYMNCVFFNQTWNGLTCELKEPIK